MAAATWMEKTVERFGKEMVDSVLTSRGLTDAIKDGVTGLNSGIKGSITRELQNMQASKVSNAAVGNIIEEFGPEKGNKVLSQIKDSGKPIQEAAEEFIQTERQYAGAVGRKDVIPPGRPGPEPKYELMAPDDVKLLNEENTLKKRKIRQNIDDIRARKEAKEQKIQAEKDAKRNNEKPNAELTDEELATRKAQKRQERQNALNEKSAAKEREAEAKAAEKAELIERAGKEPTNEKYGNQYRQQQRAIEAEDMKERGVVGKALHKIGGGVEALFGNANVRTNESGAIINSFGSRNKARKAFNQFIDSQFVQNGTGVKGDYSFKDFKNNFGALQHDYLGDFTMTTPYKTNMDFSGIMGWAKENPIKTAGLIAVTGVGAAGLMSRRDGD